MTLRCEWKYSQSIHSLTLMLYFPHRWKEFCQYKLLILCRHRQFGGCVWMGYDPSFRKHAVASELVEWTSIGVQLYNFHTVGASSSGAAGFVANSSGPPALWPAHQRLYACYGTLGSLFISLCFMLICPQMFEWLWPRSDWYLPWTVPSSSQRDL